MKKLFILSIFFNLAFASELKIYDDQHLVLLEQTTDPQNISVLLDEIKVRFEQWEATHPLSPSSTENEIKLAYQSGIERIMREDGFEFIDVLRMYPDHPKKVELRDKFLNEHTHDEPEVRFFVEGSGLFFFHVGNRIYSVLCERRDLMSIPPNYPHWFDMGAEPFFTAIRFFTRTEGWIPHFTGDPIAKTFLTETESH